ncbi:hypothetical protein GCM10023405_09020 [Streptomonospora salina]
MGGDPVVEKTHASTSVGAVAGAARDPVADDRGGPHSPYSSIMTAGAVPIGPGTGPHAIILRLTHPPFPAGRAMTPSQSRAPGARSGAAGKPSRS